MQITLHKILIICEIITFNSSQLIDYYKTSIKLCNSKVGLFAGAENLGFRRKNYEKDLMFWWKRFRLFN